MNNDEKTLDELRQDLCKEVDKLKDNSFKLMSLNEMLMKENKELTRQNQELRVHVEELKVENKTLMKIVMKTPDSTAFPEIAHYINFALIEVLKDKRSSDEEKLENLKIYLKPSLDKDTYQSLSYIEEFKQEHDSYDKILNELVSWIKVSYKLN